MDPKYVGETLKHLEKESELLVNAHKAMSDELHTLQVEEEMLMRKFYELMSAHGHTKEKDLYHNADDQKNGLEVALVDDQKNGLEVALVDVSNGADERQE